SIYNRFMPYIDKLLGRDERIVFHTRRHGFVLFSRIFKELLILIVIVVGFFALQQTQLEQRQILNIGLAAVTLIVLIAILMDFLRWKSEEFTVTNRRV